MICHTLISTGCVFTLSSWFPCDVSSHIPKLKITFRFEVLVLTFDNVLARQGSSFCNRASLNFYAFALRDMKMAARKGCCVGQKMSYRLSFGN